MVTRSWRTATFAFCGLLACAASQPALQLTESVVLEAPGIVHSLQTSPDNRHVFTIVIAAQAEARTRGDWALYRDGVLVGEYNGALPRVPWIPPASRPGLRFSFSADGEHYAFVGQRSGTQFVVRDGIEGRAYDAVSDVHLSDDGASMAYVVGKSPAKRLVLNGREGPEYWDVRVAGFDNSGRLVHTVHTGTVSWSLVDEVTIVDPIPERDPVHGYQSSDVRLSPDRSRIAVVFESNLGARLVMDGTTVGPYPSVSALSFSPDARRYAFIVMRRSQALAVVVDGVQYPINGDLERSGLYFGTSGIGWSPDGRTVAWIVRRDSRLHIVQNGVESRGYLRIGNFSTRFLADGRLAYSAHDGSRWTTYLGAEQLPDRRLAAITLDGTRRAFWVGDSTREIEFDGRRCEAPSDIHEAYFSGPRGKHLICRGGNVGGPYWLMIDGALQPAYGGMEFTPDENHVAIYSDSLVRVDGVSVVPPDASRPLFSFDGNAGFRVFALRGNRVVLIGGRF